MDQRVRDAGHSSSGPVFVRRPPRNALRLRGIEDADNAGTASMPHRLGPRLRVCSYHTPRGRGAPRPRRIRILYVHMSLYFLGEGAAAVYEWGLRHARRWWLVVLLLGAVVGHDLPTAALSAPAGAAVPVEVTASAEPTAPPARMPSAREGRVGESPSMVGDRAAVQRFAPVSPPVAACAVARRAAPTRGAHDNALLTGDAAPAIVITPSNRFGAAASRPLEALPSAVRRALLQVFRI